VECGVWSVECGVWSVECGVWSVECGVWSVECGGWSVEGRGRVPLNFNQKAQYSRYVFVLTFVIVKISYRFGESRC